ncbi:MAG: hypothetical protein CVV56_07260 [Tenericutes bacterium HGW-Tenericutes-1]|jgi:NitT/TauT family transport system permease protein|nr:MAG: hypothetical protein CVV56_07260 [Tenericutes bacterium HGW-Tenericutes-1]
MKKNLWSLGSVFILFIIWIIASSLISNEIVMPSPLSTLKAFFSIMTEGKHLEAIFLTLFRLLVALFFATLLGVTLGVFSGLNTSIRYVLRPIVTFLRTIPVISIVVILLIVFGFTITPYLITFLMIFPLIFQAISDGIENLEQELIDVFKLEDDSLLDGVRYCYLPLIGPQIKTVLLQSAGLGIKVLVMAEYLSQTRNSIGNSLYLAKVNLDYASVFAWTLLLIIIVVILEQFIRRFSYTKSAITSKKLYSKE